MALTSGVIWLRVGDVPTFGWLETPDDGRVRAAVLLCPPLAGEMISAHDALQELSGALVDRNMAVLRLDYPGTGDSADLPPDGDAVPVWSAAMAAGLAWLRGAGATTCAAVGMRMGATMLAAHQEALDELAAVVLWDPCLTGRSFLRQQEAIAKLIDAELGDQPGVEEGLAVPGYSWSTPTVSHLSGLSLSDAAPRFPAHSLALARSAGLEDRLRQLLDRAGLEVGRASGQPELLETATPESVLPTRTTMHVADWLSRVLPVTASSTLMAPPDNQVVIDAETGITERFVRLGPVGLAGILTEPADPIPRPLVVFLNAGSEHHVGPARQWVELSRRLAQEGFRSARIDLSGLGDSPARPGARRRVIYSPAAVEDIRDALADLTPGTPPDAVAVGLCAGAYAALEAGAVLGLRSVIAVSPILEVDLPVDGLPDDVWNGGARPRLASPRSPRAQALLDFDALKRSLLDAPNWFWRLTHHLRIQRSPAEGFRPVVDGVAEHTLVLCNAYDSRPYLDRGQWIIDKLTMTGRFRLDVVDVDHGLLAGRGRTQVADLVVGHLLSWYPAPLTASP